jgi:hypothetical protein
MRVQVERMRFVRTILALVIALSVAMPPTAGSVTFMMSSKTPDIADMASARMVKVTMVADASMATHECCPEYARVKLGDQSSDQCPIASCAAQGLFVADAARLNFPILAASPLPLPTDQIVAPHSGPPPFRPPRV